MKVPRIAIALLLCAQGICAAGARLPKVFTSHMVLQQEMPIRVWGHADSGEQIRVEFNGKSQSTQADAQGHWRVNLAAMKADSKPHRLVVRASNTIELEDVLLGEVWLAVGQSNMSRGLRYVKNRVRTEPMSFADYRLYFVGLDQVPQREQAAMVKGWASATHESMNSVFVHPTLGPYEYSEVTYYFGKAVHEGLRVPVGMISCAFPGSTAAQWIPDEHPEQRFDFSNNKPDKGPGSMYQAMLNGIPPFSIRGVIYYQGENDGSNPHYQRDLEKLIAAWRTRFENPQMPFYMTQLAQTTFSGGILQVGEAQVAITRTVDHTALAPSNDLWDGQNPKSDRIRTDKNTLWPVIGGGDPHPPNKHVVAGRLARIALAKAYGKVTAETQGPTGISARSMGNAILVKFDHAGDGLKTDDGQAPNWFELAGENGRFVMAAAKIVAADTVEVRAEELAEPRQVRFAWNTLARHNLYNSENLAAIPCRINVEKQP